MKKSDARGMNLTIYKAARGVNRPRPRTPPYIILLSGFSRVNLLIFFGRAPVYRIIELLRSPVAVYPPCRCRSI